MGSRFNGDLCRKGRHPWVPENIIGKGSKRQCKQCTRERRRIRFSEKPKRQKPPRTHCKSGRHLWITENIEHDSGKKRCGKCRLERSRLRDGKPRDYKRPPMTQCKRGHPWPESRGKDRKCTVCLPMLRKENHMQLLNRDRRKHESDPTVRKFIYITSRYGLSREQWTQILERQGNCCAICKSTWTFTGHYDWPHIDHRHSDNLVRGLLCATCNTGIGLLKEDPVVFQTAVNYLVREVPAEEAIYALPKASSPAKRRLVLLAQKRAANPGRPYVRKSKPDKIGQILLAPSLTVEPLFA